MSIEDAMLVPLRQHLVRAKAMALVRSEESKGCRPEISIEPVALEPVFAPILNGTHSAEPGPKRDWMPETSPTEQGLVRLRAWISPQQKCDWVRSELFLKHLVSLRRRAAIEIIGNRKHICIQFLCSRIDAEIVRTAFKGQFELCEISAVRDDWLADLPAHAWSKASFCDLYPPPPYAHLFTQPDELKRSPYATLITALSLIPEPALGFSQVVFIPVAPDHDWHRNVEALLDLEFSIKLIGGIPSGSQRYLQQAPSGDLRIMANETDRKSHNDKPFFAAAFRIGVVNGGNKGWRMLHSLALMAGLIQHGGRPLSALTDEHYRGCLSPETIRRMFVCGTTHRPGFLVNSWELAGLVHIPPFDVAKPRHPAMVPLETLPAGEALLLGTPIGYCDYAGVRLPVCIPPVVRSIHDHLIGRPGTGKSTLMENMILYDIRQGHGVAVLDPHGSLVQHLLEVIPEKDIPRVVYVNPGDPEWVPIWNPLQCQTPYGPGRIADDLVSAFKSFITGWGHRLEHILRNAFLGALHLPRASLLDAFDLLRQKSDESKRLRAIVAKSVDDETLKRFWQHDFDRYGAADVAPAHHKLGKLLTSGTVSLMLSQSESLFDLRDIMDSGKILLVDLSLLGAEVRETIGCLMLSLLHLTALSRAGLSMESCRPFHIHCDEAHRFVTDAIEDLIAETRKFKVTLTLAHQYMEQFGARKAGALSSVGSTIIFNVQTNDAVHLKRDLQGRVEVDELITLKRGQAIARIGSEIVRFDTLPPAKPPKESVREAIIAESRRRYCRPVEEVRRAIRGRGQFRLDGFTEGLASGGLQFDAKDFEYETF